ncbi:MAG: ATP-binding protein [Nitrospirota bacterium]|nr:ATP-binding protein [Nitrospirota bacterium]
MKIEVTLKVRSHPRYLSLIRDVTARFCMTCGLDEETVGQIKLAVDEACSNVIKYAYRGDTSKDIVVKYGSSKKQISIIIEDSGEKADPGKIQGRDLDDVRPGGLGMHFIRRVFDLVEFDPKKVKGNRLLLMKQAGGNDEL